MDGSLPGFSFHGILRQEYWSGLPFPSAGHLLEPGHPALQADCTVWATSGALWSTPAMLWMSKKMQVKYDSPRSSKKQHGWVPGTDWSVEECHAREEGFSLREKLTQPPVQTLPSPSYGSWVNFRKYLWDFPGGPVVKTCPSRVEECCPQMDEPVD